MSYILNNANTSYAPVFPAFSDPVPEKATSELLDESKKLRVELQTAQDESNFLTFLGKFSLGAIGITVADCFLSQTVAKIATQKLGFCLGNYLSNTSLNRLWRIESSLAKLNNTVGKLFEGNTTAQVLFPASFEELEFRWLVQHVLLKKLPEQVLTLISPDLAKMVDSAPARITRVAASALIFTLVHAHALNCEQGGGIYQLIGGLLYGGLFEYSEGSLLYCINFHILYNLMIDV